MLDIDYFKEVNDIFGHQIGDDCLVAVSHALSQTLRRPGDVVARFGGDEFVAILPQVKQEDTRNMAEAMRQAVIDLDIKHPSSPYGVVTISLGFACRMPSLNTHPDTLLKAADEALYRGKQKGRNSISD